MLPGMDRGWGLSTVNTPFAVWGASNDGPGVSGSTDDLQDAIFWHQSSLHNHETANYENMGQRSAANAETQLAKACYNGNMTDGIGLAAAWSVDRSTSVSPRNVESDATVDASIRMQTDWSIPSPAPADGASLVDEQLVTQAPRPVVPMVGTIPYSNTQQRMPDPLVVSAAQTIIRTDCLEYLQANSSSWVAGGPCQRQLVGTPTPLPSVNDTLSDLQLAYSAVCQLEARMADDAVRSRMALIRLHLEYHHVSVGTPKWPQGTGKQLARTAVGRGDASFIIDGILKRLHPDWSSLSEADRGSLRSRFHDRKRYGRRWAVLADGLGKGILLLCSPRVSAMV